MTSSEKPSSLKVYIPPHERQRRKPSAVHRDKSSADPPIFPLDALPAIQASISSTTKPPKYQFPLMRPGAPWSRSNTDSTFGDQQLDTTNEEDYEEEQEKVKDEQDKEDDIEAAHDHVVEVEAETSGKPYAHAKDWSGPDDEENPWNWSTKKKALHTAVPALCAFVATFASSVYALGIEDVAQDLGVSVELSILPYSLYTLGLAFGPMLAAPCSETFGRKAVYLYTLPIFALFTLGAGFSSNIASLTICRFLAGIFASPSLSIGSATISDIWLPAKRSTPMALYVATPFLGPSLGPMIGGFVVEKMTWRWTQWTILFAAILCYIPVLFIQETYKTVLLRRRAKEHNIEGPPKPQRTTKQTIVFFITSSLTRPLHMLFVEPVVAAFSLYVGFLFAVQYLFYAAFPQIFGTVYHFNIGARGLAFLSLAVGCTVGFFLIIYINKRVYLPKLKKHGRLAAEHRLYTLFIAAPCIPISLFWFAWTARPSIHWISPVIAEGLYGFGNILVFQGVTMYMMEFYGPLYGASAMGANAFVRYGLGTAFPLFALQMYGYVGGKGLGIAGATSLLGAITVLLATIPVIFWFTGPKLRSISHFKHST